MPIRRSMQARPLTIESLEITRGDIPLFKPLSLRTQPGEIWNVQGDNGSGKSTLLMALAGLHPIAAGSIRYGDDPLHRHSDYPRCVLYLGHKRALRLSQTVRTNVKYWADLHGAPELAEAALHYFDLDAYADMLCRSLSSGWRERVALTRLLTQPAALWLLDEPASHLDEAGLHLLHSLITARIEQGGTVILTTHINIAGGKANNININDLK